MKLKLSINTIFSLVAFYPLLLIIPSFFGVNAFFLTAPYFLGVCVILVIFIALQGKLSLFKLLPLILVLLCLIFLNFSSLRYSLPIFVIIFILFLFIFLKNSSFIFFNEKLSEYIFYVYLIFSILFLFLSNGWEEETGRFIGFVGSPTVYAGFIVSSYVLVATKLNIKSRKFIYLTLITIILVYLSKTRLILIFIMIYPVLKYLRESFEWLTLKRMFLFFLLVTISIYPLYGIVTNFFPSLVSIRYEGGRDASFGLRYFLYEISVKDFKNSTTKEQIFGHGNEYSRNKIAERFQMDIMPHNDFVRLLLDWGLLGLFFFLLLLYRLSKKNDEVCYLVLIYMLLFYSNMVFNIFLLALIVIFSSKHEIKNRFANNTR